MMPGHRSIEENLRFLIVEVTKQLTRLGTYLKNPTEGMEQRVSARDDYIDNLKSFIQKRVFAVKPDESWTINFLKAAEVVAVNLERIADFCESVISQVGYLEDPDAVRELDAEAFLAIIDVGMSKIEHALFERDVQTALEICQAEWKLDRLYSSVFRQILDDLEGSEQPQSLVTILFMSHYFERMGDSLLNIGEAIASACLGKSIKIEQLNALADVDPDERLRDVSLEGFGETRSGCLIARVSKVEPEDSGGRGPAVFKEGRAEKLREEKEGIERWNAVVPGLAPQVYSFREDGENGAILYEYLAGRTFEDILLNGTKEELENAFERIAATLTRIWRQTRTAEPTRSTFLQQLKKRLPDVYAVHGDYRDRRLSIGSMTIPGLGELIASADAVEQQIPCPFSVLGHGDFNLDNVILETEGRGVRFIDLHRARMMDYLQDISVFMVSNLRLQVFQRRIKTRINWTVDQARAVAGRFAHEVGDELYGLRLAFGVARSLITSTRFVLDERLARSMFLRGRYLLERALAHGLAPFTIPQEVLLA